MKSTKQSSTVRRPTKRLGVARTGRTTRRSQSMSAASKSKRGKR